jgi:multidrug efflux system outer membrane protein
MTRNAIAIAAMTSLAACSLEPHYMRPPEPVPASWPVGDSYLRQSEAALASVTYRDIFRDPKLQALIEQALVNNRDLRIAAANIAAARAQYRVQRAGLFPRVDAGLGASVSDRGNRSGSGAGASTGGVQQDYSADVGISSFELDLFGRVRSLSHAALQEYFATEAAARATRLALVGQLATAYLTYAADQSLLRIARETSANAQRSVTLTEARLRGGIASRIDLSQARTVLDTARSDEASLTTAVAQDANLLQLLVGGPVDPALLPAGIEQVDYLLAELPAGLSSTVLLRRPDVVEAEYRLRAANARIGAARAAFFPTISLTGLLGLASSTLGGLFTGGAFTWSAGANASVPIFDAGANRGKLRLSQAQRDAALAQYERTIQVAFREVADALARRGTIDTQVRAQEDLVASARDNAALTEARYRGGIDSFLESLDAQRTFYGAQRSLVATRLARATNLADLYTSLGGDALIETADWSERSLPAPAAH